MLDVITHQDLLDALPISAAVVDECGRIVSVNTAWHDFAAANEVVGTYDFIGQSYIAVCEEARGASSAEARIVADGLRRVLQGEDRFVCEYPCHSPLEERWFEVTISPLLTGGRRLALVIHHNITTRKIEQIGAANAHGDASSLAAIVASSTDAIFTYDLEGRILTWNRAAEELYGYTAEEAVGQSVEFIYPENWPVRITDYRDRIISGEMTHFEVVRQTKDGELRDIAISAAPIRGADGVVRAISNFHRDITDAKAIERHLKHVQSELTHRTKNLLGIIGAIQRQTARSTDSVEEFQQAFAARLASMTESIELLVGSGWGHVSLETLCRRQLAAFSDHDGGRITLMGPRVLVSADAAQSIGMGLHELATNAMKYGALGTPGGRIAIDWTVVPGEERRLQLRWIETADTIAEQPPGTGFGRMVLTRLAGQKLRAETDLTFATGKLEWSILLPEDHFRRA